MRHYSVDADALTALGFSLGDIAGAGPEGRLDDAVGCGSARVAAALDSSATAFCMGWGDAAESLVALAVGAVEAADVYRQSDSVVAAAASSAASVSAASATGSGSVA